MLLIVAVIILTLVAAVDGLVGIRSGFGDTWKRTVRKPEFAAALAFLIVVFIDIAFTMRLPQWEFGQHTALDTALLLLPLLPGIMWVITLAVREHRAPVPRRTLLLLLASDLIWTGVAAWWLSWTLRFGAVKTAEDFAGVLEGLLPLLGLPISAWALARRARSRV